MAIEIGVLRALLSLDSAAFQKGAKRAEASMGGLQRSLTAASRKLGSIGRKMTTRLTLPIVGIGAAAVRSSMATIDAQSKMAQSLGTSTASMQILARAADRAGVSTGEMEQIARQLTKRLSEVAATGKGPAASALKRLNLTAKGLEGLTLDQKIATINKAIQDTIPAAEQAAIATALFGSRAGIAAGRLDAATIEAARLELERFGVTVTEIEADRIEEANDAISALGLVSRGLGNQLAVALAPILQGIAETLADWGAKFSALDPKIQSLIGGVLAFAAAAGPLAMGIGFIASGLAALASPIGLVIVGLVAVAGAAAYVVANWDGIKRDYPATASALEKVGEAGRKLGAGMVDAVRENFGAAELQIRSAVAVYDGLIRGDFALIWDGLKGIVSSALSSAISTIDLFTLGGASALRDALAGISGTFDTLLPGFTDRGRQLVANIKAGIVERHADLALAGLRMAGNILEGFKTRISDVVQAVKSIGPKIISAIAEMAAEVIAAARQLGADLVNGIKEGIAQRIDLVRSGIRDAFNSLIGTAKETVDSHSPSRVFMQIGRDMLEGTRLGIGQKAGAAAAAAAAAGKAATDAMNEAVEAAGPSKLEQVVGQIGDAMAQAIVDGENMGEALRGVFKQIAKDLISSGISQLIKGLFGGGSGAGGGGFLGGIFKGFFANGGTLGAGEWGIAGEAGPEPVVGPARIISNRDAAAMGGGGGGSMALTVRVEGARGNAEIEEMVERGVSSGLAQYDRILPDRVEAVRRDPRVRY